MKEGLFDFNHAVNQGWIAGVTDAESMLLSMFVGRMRSGYANNWAEVDLQRHREQLEGNLPPAEPAPFFDQFGNPMPLAAGGGQGPLNVANTDLVSGASSTARSPSSAAGGV